MTRAQTAMAAPRFARRTGRRLSRSGRPGRALALLPLAAVLLSITAAGCRPQSPKEPVPPAPTRPLTEVLAAHTPELMALPGVVGTAESRLPDGRPCVLVLVARLTPELRDRLPRTLDGWPVRIEESGEIHAMPDSAR